MKFSKTTKDVTDYLNKLDERKRKEGEDIRTWLDRLIELGKKNKNNGKK